MKKILACIFFAVLIQGCSSHQTSIVAGKENFIDTAAGSCPYLTKDLQGHVVLSWVKKIDPTRSVFCYAVSYDNGRSFNAPIQIPSSKNIHAHAENLPKLIFKPSGEIMAVWGAANPSPKNLYSGLVFYAQSFDKGKTWSDAKKLVNDTAGYDQRYFDVALMPNGEAAIIWLDNRKKTNKEGSALYFATTNGSNGFRNEKLISEPCCECCRTDLFIDSKKNIHILYRAIINDSIRDMVHAVSTDGGNTFSKPVKISNDNWVINGCPHTGPAMAENKDGLHFTWFTAGAGTGVFYDRSTDNGHTFTNKDSLSSRSGRHPQITALTNGNLAIVWDENFQKDNQYLSKIGLQERSVDGEKMNKNYITAQTASASYPVVTCLGNTAALVAYTTSIGNKDHVAYRVVEL